MVKILKFWGYCVAYAWRGSVTLANAWQGLWGTILLWAFGYWRKIPVAIPDKVDDYALLFLLASLGVTWVGVFLFQFVIAPAKLYWEQRESADRLKDSSGLSELETDVPDVRVADEPVVWRLFETRQRDSLIPLLEGAKIDSWGRAGNGHPAPSLIQPTKWTTHTLQFLPASAGGINQTFLKSKKAPYETASYYDVHLNRAQIKRRWPGLWESPERIPCTELLTIAAAIGWDFISKDSLHLIDLQKAMRQGALDEVLKIWGKSSKWTSENLTRDEVLEEIPKGHWQDHFIHLFAARDNDNFNVYSWIPDAKDFGRRGYIDLHVERYQAILWLRKQAEPYKSERK